MVNTATRAWLGWSPRHGWHVSPTHVWTSSWQVAADLWLSGSGDIRQVTSDPPDWVNSLALLAARRLFDFVLLSWNRFASHSPRLVCALVAAITESPSYRYGRCHVTILVQLYHTERSEVVLRGPAFSYLWAELCCCVARASLTYSKHAVPLTGEIANSVEKNEKL